MTDPNPGPNSPQPRREGVARRILSSRLGALLLSWDFAIGAVLGVAMALAPARSAAVSATTSDILLAICGIGAGLASLVLTAMTVLIGVFGKAYTELLNRTPNGVGGALRPYLIVVYLSVVASLSALALCLTWPLVSGLAWGAMWALTAIPFVAMSWALLGCIQTIHQLVGHVHMNRKADDLAERAQRAYDRRTA